MNNLFLKKCEKSVTDVRKGKTKERSFPIVNDRKCFALFHFIFTNQNKIFVSVSSTIKVVNVANYHITATGLEP